MKKHMSTWVLVVCLVLLAITMHPKQSLAAMGYVDNQAAIVGQLLHYDESSDTFTIYGRHSRLNNNNVWQIIETQKFFQLLPTQDSQRDTLKNNLGSGIKAFGTFHTAVGLREQTLLLRTIQPYDPNLDRKAGVPAAFGPTEGPFAWNGFGVVVQPTRFSKMDLTRASDFVNYLAGVRDAYLGENGERQDRVVTPDKSLPGIKEVLSGTKPADATYKRIADWWHSRMKTHDFLEKDTRALNECIQAAGGLAFFTGKLGTNTGLVEFVPAMRKDLDHFMNQGSFYGSLELKEQSGIFFARLRSETVTENGVKKIQLYATGPFFETVSELVGAIRSASGGSETWRLEGWSLERGMAIEDESCWISGTKVLVREPETGNIIDYYFSVDKTLTQKELDSCLNLLREVAKEGGV